MPKRDFVKANLIHRNGNSKWLKVAYYSGVLLVFVSSLYQMHLSLSNEFVGEPVSDAEDRPSIQQEYKSYYELKDEVLNATKQRTQQGKSQRSSLSSYSRADVVRQESHM